VGNVGVNARTERAASQSTRVNDPPTNEDNTPIISPFFFFGKKIEKYACGLAQDVGSWSNSGNIVVGVKRCVWKGRCALGSNL